MSKEANIEILTLYDKGHTPPAVTKVGIIPFIQISGQFQMMVMKPRAEAKRLGAPAFQIAKGTRRIHINERWCDMREDDLIYADACFHEALVATALREGREEVGLKAENVIKLYDMGGYEFISASRGLPKPIHVFAARIQNAGDFLPFEATTQEARFMTLEEFESVGRADHLDILRKVWATLKKVV